MEMSKFWEKVKVKDLDDCWEFQGAKTHNGYGKHYESGFNWRAHRYVWYKIHGLIPDSINVLHGCDNPACCNPMHLFLGTQADNLKDRDNKNRQAKGENNGRAKLTFNDAMSIIARRGKGTSIGVLAKKYGVCREQIYKIINGKSWGWLFDATKPGSPGNVRIVKDVTD